MMKDPAGWWGCEIKNWRIYVRTEGKKNSKWYTKYVYFFSKTVGSNVKRKMTKIQRNKKNKNKRETNGRAKSVALRGFKKLKEKKLVQRE